MGGRGNNRGRGRGGSFKPQPKRDHLPSIKDRLGNIPTYKKNNYKFVRQSTATETVAPLPPETKIKTLSKKFLKSYYEIFDQPATFPMPTLGRNLLEVREAENRISLLVYDKTKIAEALATFSPTEHLISFLSIDVPFYIVNPMSVTSMQIVVTGVFKDTSQETNPLKAFTRVFILKQASVDQQGEPVYKIYNDLFMLQPPTPDQIKRYHHELQISKSHPNKSNSSTTGGDSESRKQAELLKSIMAKTRMNTVGSRQLLQDCNWDENKSIEVFNTLFAANSIPQGYFTP